MRFLLLLTGLVSVSLSCVAGQLPKYIFLFIGDGMSVPQRMIAEEFSRKVGMGSLAMNEMPLSAMTRTCSANSLVTDSAAAATAIACGVKTNNGSIGVDAEGKRVESVAEVAKKCGKKVGMLTTVTITHATPAGFYGHRTSRGDTYGIALDLADSGFDLFAGGGIGNKFDDKKHKQYSGDAYGNASKKGYRIVKDKREFMDLKPGCGKILTRFTDDCLESAIDVTDEVREKQPTIAEMVTKAIEILDNKNGFFLMTEGGKIDYAGHSNDAATNLRDVLAMDEAVKVAMKFQEEHPNETLIVVTGDHETGGMTMGFAGTGYALYMERLAGQTMSVARFAGKAKRMMCKNADIKLDDIKPLVENAFGFRFNGDVKKDPMVLTENERKSIESALLHDLEISSKKVEENAAYDGKKNYLLGGACRLVMSSKCGIGWSTGGHTAMPVLTTAKGVEAERFSGLIENTDIAVKLKQLLLK